LQDPEASQEYREDVVAVLEPGNSVEQTFFSRRPEINQIHLWLAVDKGVDLSGNLTVELYSLPKGDNPLVQHSFSLERLSRSNMITVPLQTSEIKYPAGEFTVRLFIDKGKVSLLGRNEDAYAQGGLFINQEAMDGDLSFRLGYNYGLAALGEDLNRWASGIWLLIPCLLVLWLPGRLLLRLARFGQQLDWGERSALSVGLSVAIVPLVMLWTSQIGLHWNRASIWIIFGLLMIIYLATTRWKQIEWRISWTTLALAGVLIFSLGVRLAMVRDLAAPAWVDSVHHALITRIFLEQGGYPQTWAPYVETSTINYHAGYHSLLATFTWLSGLEIAQAMLLFGQILNLLAVLAVYLFAKTLTQRPGASIFAAIIAGLMTPMPAYYTSWGRYTQLAGLLLLPVAFMFIKMIIDRPVVDKLWRMDKTYLSATLLAGLSIAGLILVHYRVLAFEAALVIAYVLIAWVKAAVKQSLWPQAARDVLAFFLIGLVGLALTLPWWPTTLNSFVLPVATFRGTQKPFSDFAWSYLNTALGRYALGLAGLGLAWSLIQRCSLGLLMVIWVVIMFFFANLGVWRLPGASFVNNTSVAITLFFPIAVLGGYVLDWVGTGWERFVPGRWKPLYWAGIGLATLALMMVSARSLLPILNPGTLLVRRADLPAIEWIDENLPSNASVLINPFLWGYGLYAGNDGGYWISPLAGRNTLPPSVLYFYNLEGDKGAGITSAVKNVIEVADHPDALSQFLLDQGIRYIYIGVRGGILSPKMLLESPGFQLLYNQSGAYVFKVLDPSTQ
jgi:hypothetical protein